MDADRLEAEIAQAVEHVVRRQVETGLDIVSDGEQGKSSFVGYVEERLTGFAEEPIERVRNLEAREFGDEVAGASRQVTPCIGPVEWKDFGPLERDLENLKRATAGLDDRQAFVTAVSPGTLANNHPNRYFDTREEYLACVAEAMRREYEAIAAAGFIVQLDCPDLAQHSYNWPDLPVRQWLDEVIRLHVDALNESVKNIPRDQVRVHVCWGASEGAHNHDTELSVIIEHLLRLEVGAVSVVAANGRHEHEWRDWQGVELPDGMSIIPGVIDSTTNIIEHPRTVADRIERFAAVLGKENVIAGVDCGFGTVANMDQVHPEVAWAKLGSLVEGARIASERLWS